MQQNDNIKKDISAPSAGISDIFSVSSKTSVYPDRAYVQVHKRFERIAAALYILTNRVADTEALRGAVRSTALDAVSITASLSEGFRDGKNLSLINLERACIELTTAVRLLVAAKCTSRANAELVVRAIEEALALAIGLQDSVLAEDVVITRDDLLPEQLPVKRASATGALSAEKRISNATSPVANAVASSSNQVALRKQVGVASGVSREATILSVLRKYGPLGIKDVAIHMPDCGEKTVQRALAALVSAGSIRKEGEKRWSKYHVL